MKTLYCCYTNYHLLITLLKANPEDQVLLFEGITERREKVRVLKKHGYFSKIYLKDLEDKVFEPSIFLEEGRKKKISIYNDFTCLGRYLRGHKIEYHLIEDGYNVFQHPLPKIYLSRKWRLFYRLFQHLSPFGYSPYVKSIEVNDKQVVLRDKRYSKMIEVPRKGLFQGVEEEKRQGIFEVFGGGRLPLTQKKSLLLLTQPLYIGDYFKEIVSTKEEQLQYYKEIVEAYQGEYEVYVKVHPRDMVDYSSIRGIRFLEKNVPMELYEWMEQGGFHLGIAYSSTVLSYLNCVKEKLFLNQKEIV